MTEIMTAQTLTPSAAEASSAVGSAVLTKQEAEALIADARGRIDALDTDILELVRRRVAVSAEVQTARIAAGGPRLSLTREMEILDRYRAQLGSSGTEIAMLLLELCRGRV
ncbi:chorismate mutase [Streptacidiphilus sp. MAP12-33]|uniref:chorismate mutase n=1 Tax=Streptacidiphilus sp. MAP12-33 TaxID=3156266 RepID=UPI003512FD86